MPDTQVECTRYFERNTYAKLYFLYADNEKMVELILKNMRHTNQTSSMLGKTLARLAGTGKSK